MKKQLSAILLALLFISMPSLPAKAAESYTGFPLKEALSAGENISPMGDFEATSEADIPEGATEEETKEYKRQLAHFNSSKTGGKLETVEDAARGGRVLHAISTNPDGALGMAFRAFDLQVGATYQVSAYLKTKAITAKGAYIKAEFFSEKQYNAKYILDQQASEYFFDTEGQWELAAWRFTVPTDAKLGVFIMRLDYEGELYWDDVKIYKVSEPPYMFYTGDIFPYSDMAEARAEVTFNTAQREIDMNGTVKFVLKKGTSTLFQKTVPVGETASYTYKIADYLTEKKTEYTMRAEYWDSGGKKVETLTESIYLYDRPTRLTRDGKFLKDDGTVLTPVIGYHVDIEDMDRYPAFMNAVQGPNSNDPALMDFLDKALEKDIMVIVCLYPSMFPAAHYKNINKTKRCIEQVKNHKAVLGYAVMDEPFGNSTDPVETYLLLKESYKIIRDLDSEHPVYICENKPEYCTFTRNCVDALGIDPYPGNTHDPYTYVTERTALAKAAATNGKPVYSILQAWEYHEYEPTANDMRHMIYQTLLTGAKGYGYFEVNDTGSRDSSGEDMWERPLYSGAVGAYGMMPQLMDALDGKYTVLADKREEGADTWLYAWQTDANTAYVLALEKSGEAKTVECTVPFSLFTYASQDGESVEAEQDGNRFTLHLQGGEAAFYRLRRIKTYALLKENGEETEDIAAAHTLVWVPEAGKGIAVVARYQGENVHKLIELLCYPAGDGETIIRFPVSGKSGTVKLLYLTEGLRPRNKPIQLVLK